METLTLQEKIEALQLLCREQKKEIANLKKKVKQLIDIDERYSAINGCDRASNECDQCENYACANNDNNC